MNNNRIEIGTNISSPINTGEVKGDLSSKVEISNEKNQNLCEAAEEIQKLLQQLEETYSPKTTPEKMTVIAHAIENIDNNPNFSQRILSALKAGGTEALAQALNHPLSSFLLAALEDWKKTKLE